MKIRNAVLALGIGINLSACATVLNGTNIDYPVTTDPDGASVVFLNGITCESPCEIELRRKSDTRIDISKEGFEPTYVLVQSRLAGSTFGNILAGGIVGAAVDGGNGASNTLAPRPLFVRLAPLGSGEAALLLDKDGEVVSTVDEHNEEVRKDVAKTIGNEMAEYSGADSLEDAIADDGEPTPE